MSEIKRSRGRPKKVIEIKLEEPVKEQIILPAKIDTRVDKNTIPIKYNEDLVRDIRGSMMIYPRTERILINQALLMIDWFVNTMDTLDNSKTFSEDGGWKKKFKIQEPRVNLPKYTQEELNDNVSI